MTRRYRAELRVDHVHRLSSRELLMLSGRLSGEPFAVGDSVFIETPIGDTYPAVIKVIELHSPPGLTTVGIESATGDIPTGSVLGVPFP